MALDVALVLRLVDRLSGPLKKPIASTEALGKTAAAGAAALDRFGGVNGDLSHFGKLDRAADAARKAIGLVAPSAVQMATSIGAQQADIEHFRDLKQAVVKSEAQLKKAKGSAADLGRQLKLTAAEDDFDPKEIKRLTREMNSANLAVKRLKTTHGEQAMALEGVRRGLREAGINTRDLASESRRLTRETEAHNRALERQGRIQDSLSRNRARLGSMNERIERNNSRRANMRGAAFETAALGYGAMRFIGGAGESQSRLTDIGITGGLTLPERDSLRGTVETTAVEQRQTRASIMEAMQILVSAGIDKGIAASSLAPIARTATAGAAAVPDIATTSIAVLNNMELPVEKLERALDMMTKGGDLANFELRDMASKFESITAFAASEGIKGEDGLASLVAAAQIARRTAGSGDGAATNLENLLAKLSSVDTINNFKQLGVDYPERMAELQAEGKNKLDAIIQITRETIEDDPNKISVLFRDLNASKMIRKLIADREDYKGFKSEISNNSDGTVDKFFNDRVANDPTIALKMFGDDLNKFRDRIALPLIPVITDLMEAITPLVERFGAWAAANPELLAQIGSMVGTLLMMKAAFVVLGVAATTLVTPFLWLGKGLIYARMGMAMLGVTGAGTLSLMTRLGLGAAGLTGRVAGLGWAFGKGMVADIAKLSTSLIRFGSPVLRGVVAGGLGIVKLGLRSVASAMMLNPVGAVVAALAATAYVLWDNWENVTGWFDEKTERVKSAFGDGFLNGMVQLVHEFNPFRLLWDTVDGLVDYLFGIDLSGWFSDLGSGIAEMTSNLRGLLGLRDAEDARSVRLAAATENQTQAAFEQSDQGKTAAAAVAEYAALDARGLAAPAPLQIVPSYGQSLAQQGSLLPSVEGMRAALGIDAQRASGGPVWSGGSFLVGERGPEIISSSRAGFVTPHSALTFDTRPALRGAASSPAAQGRGEAVTIEVRELNVNAAPHHDAHEVAELVRLELAKLMRGADRSDHDLHDGSELFQ